MAAFQGSFVSTRAKPNGRYIEVAVLQRAGIARVYTVHTCLYCQEQITEVLNSNTNVAVLTTRSP